MISEISITNFGPIKEVKDFKLDKINLIIGRNGSGKTYLLKSMYVAQKCLEQHQRGKEPRSLNDLLFDKLYWTFQADKIGNLVNKDAPKLAFKMKNNDGGVLEYSFGSTTEKSITKVSNTIQPIPSNSIYLPAKEILSLQDAIKISRSDSYNIFGFDDTYYDLSKALTPTKKGKNYKIFSDVRKSLNDTLCGHIEYDDVENEWYFIDNKRHRFEIGILSEGVKKISIIDVLLGNHYLSKNSIIFIDEPESALHPELISQFMEIIYSLSKLGIQIIIASHSYFVINKLTLIAQRNRMSIPVLSANNDAQSSDSEIVWSVGNLKEGLPDNPIIRESIKLYEEEIDL